MGLTLGHGAWQIDQPSNGSMWNSYSFQPVGQWMGYSFTDLGAEGCCRSLNALLLFILYLNFETQRHSKINPRENCKVKDVPFLKIDFKEEKVLCMKFIHHACRLACGRVSRRGQSQGATYTGGFQHFIVWALMPRPKLKSRGATNTGDATNAGGITVLLYDFADRTWWRTIWPCYCQCSLVQGY